jgi:hypothetical protein
LLPLGIALNGTSTVLYGSVAELAPDSRRAHAFAVFYTATLGAGAVARRSMDRGSDRFTHDHPLSGWSGASYAPPRMPLAIISRWSQAMNFSKLRCRMGE